MERSNEKMHQHRSEELGFVPQREIIYNKLLPYAKDLDKESTRMFSEIKANLGRSIMMREMRPGCGMWTARLNKFIKLYGLKFCKEDHIYLIKLMYELVTIPNLEPYLVSKFAQVLIILLKKKELISPQELELSWKPLYELCKRILSSSRGAIGMYRYFSSLEITLDSLVHAARFYFPASSTEEMLDELKPLLCPLDTTTMTNNVETLEWFLPIALPPNQSHKGYKLWFEDFMTIWERCDNNTTWESDMMWLMARLARCNIGYIDWEPHIPLMFTRFLRSLHLPVSYKQIQHSKHHKLETSAIALWIVSVLGGNSSAQKYLDKFMKSLESYFYPANFGRWLAKLSELLSKLPLYFVQRLHFERYKKLTWETPVPETHKLTEEDITRFVESIKQVTKQAMFSKIGLEVGQALQHLATLRPAMIIPEVVESVYTNLETLVQPHKFQAALHCVIAVIRPMIEGGQGDFKEGPTHLIPLLLAVLPGIDPNDTRKCFVALHFITTVATMVPMADSSKASEYHHDLTEEEETICRATANFEDFVLQFLDRCFLLVESSSLESTRLDRDSERRSRLENMAESALASTCVGVLMQTSPQIFKSAIKKLHSFVMGRILETKVAGQFIATICRSFTKVNAYETLRMFVPCLCDNILTLTESDDILKEEILDKELLYNLLILTEVVDCIGSSLVPHVPVLRNVLDRTLHLTCREGHVLAAKLLRNILRSFGSLLPMEFRSVPRSLDQHVKDYLPVRDWGKPGNIHDLKLKWYVPGDDEVACAQSLLEIYLPPEIQLIENFVDDKVSLGRDQLQCCLGIIAAILGCKTLLPTWDEEPLELIESCLAASPFNTSIPPTITLTTHGKKRSVVMPDGSNVRQTLVKVMDKLQLKLLKCKEDDTKSFVFVISIWESLLSTCYEDKAITDVHWRRFRVIKRVLENRLIGGKRHLRSLLIDRALLQHEILLERNTLCLTPTHKLIMMNLLTLSISEYGEIRLRAQSKLFTAIENFSYSYTILIPKLVECLKKDPLDEHNQFKGALYVLLGPKQNPVMTRHSWDMLNSLWPALVRAKPSEKVSIIRLLESLVDVVHKQFPTITINLEIPDSCIEAARKLWEQAPYPSQGPLSDADVLEGARQLEHKNQNNLRQYLSLLDSLLKAIENENLHWRFHSMALSLMRDLVHPDVEYPASVVRCFLSTVIHDSLELRKIATRTLVFILKQQKQTHKQIIVDPFALFGFVRPEKIYPGDRPDNQWVQYKATSVPRNSDDWDQNCYVHKTYHGYYTWPKELKMYAPSSEQPQFQSYETLTEGRKEVFTFFSSPENIAKFVEYLCLEEKKGKDKFNGYRFFLFKGLFRNGGYDFVKPFQSHLQRLVVSKHESHQRCAAEIIAGSIRGSKHWPYGMVKELWEFLGPLISTALDNISDETLNDWGVCFATSSENRDPRRNHWLFEVLMEESEKNVSSFVECGRMYALQGALNQQLWRVSELLTLWLERLKPYLAHPFQNVRERIGSVINNIFEADITFPGGNPPKSPRVTDFVAYLVPQLQVLYRVGPLATNQLSARTGDKEKYNHIKNHVSERGQHSEEFPSPTECSVEMVDEDTKDKAIRLMKTVCRWISASVQRSQFGIAPDAYQLFPLLCLMESYEADEELCRSCTFVLVVMGQTTHIPQNVPAALAAIQKVSQCMSWQARASCLEFLQVWVFNNMPVILSSEEWTNEVKSIVLRLLEDDWLDVREKAAQVLSGLLHTGIIEDSLSLLEIFKNKVHVKFGKNKQRVDPVVLKQHHSVILGLCAFINAYPYDIPDFIPDLFVVFGEHLNDPQPIPSTIRKTLGDFKRTHHDSWTQHTLKFSEEQLAVLGDLIIPPSYYA